MKEMRLMKWLPETDIQLLRLVVIGLATGSAEPVPRTVSSRAPVVRRSSVKRPNWYKAS